MMGNAGFLSSTVPLETIRILGLFLWDLPCNSQSTQYTLIEEYTLNYIMI